MSAGRVEWLVPIEGDGRHDAVTTLARWNDRTWLAFRRADSHWPDTPGAIHVLVSDDGRNFEPSAIVDTDLDDRDPKLVADGERLLLYLGCRRETDAGGWIESFACETRDGSAWTAPAHIGHAGQWLWSPVRLDAGFLCAAYGFRRGSEPPAQRVDLLGSADGYAWTSIVPLLAGGVGNETALAEERDGSLVAVARGSDDSTHLLRAADVRGPWTATVLDHWAHAPELCRVGDVLVLAGRERDGDGGYLTRLWTLAGDATEPLLDLPSGGDTSYAGMVADGDDALLVSWYSQHEHLDEPGFRVGYAPATVYVARVTLT